MNRTPDPVELLRAANPVDPTQVDGPNTPHAQNLLASILATPRTPDPVAARRHRRRLLAVFLASSNGAGWVLAAGLVPILLLGVYGYWAGGRTTRPPSGH